MKKEISTPTKLTEAIKNELIAGTSKEEILKVAEMVSAAYDMVKNYKKADLGFVEHKTCRSCGDFLPLDSFAKRSQNKDGRDASCKACNKTWRSEWKANKAKSEKALNEIQNAGII